MMLASAFGFLYIYIYTPPPTNIAPDTGSLEEETNLPGTLPEVPC